MEKLKTWSVLDKLGLLLIGFGVVLSAWYVLHGDIIFHSDIARDLVLLEEAVTKHKIPLLGPRTGAIPGLFHGPAWLYANLPGFVIGRGNPVAIGWGWVIMEIGLLIGAFLVGRAIFGTSIAIWTTALLSSRVPLFSHQLFNPSGLSITFPIYFYFLWRYFNQSRPRDLVMSTLLAGLMIHFQVVFGAPMFLILLPLTVWKVSTKSARWWHIALLSFIVIPLSTYIVFDLRHNFVQLNTLIKYVQADIPVYMTLAEVIRNRCVELTTTLSLLSRGSVFWLRGLSIVFWICVLRGLWRDNKSHFFTLYLITYIAFWSFSLIIFEPIKGYYFDFSFLNTLIFISQLEKMNKFIASALIGTVLFINFKQAKVVAFSTQDFSGNMESSWIYNRELGRLIVDDAPENFSVFTLDTDIFGYSANYGIRYMARVASKQMNSLTKSQITYLVIAKNTINHPHFDVRWWREDQVKIKAKPVKTWDYLGRFLIEKYELTTEEAAIPEDVNLMSNKTNLR